MRGPSTVVSVLVMVLYFVVSPVRATPAVPQTTAWPALGIQVLLDRAGFSSGEIDGVMGRNTRAALAAFRDSRTLPDLVSDEATIQVALETPGVETLAQYTMAAADVAGPFTPSIPDDLVEQSKLPALDYTSPLEALAEKFHASPKLLTALNTGAAFAVSETIRVPNVIVDAATPPKAAKVVVSREASVLRALDAEGRIVFHAPVTSGSEHDPLPLGEWTVTAVQKNPVFYYNPRLFWDADPRHSKAKIPAGPNSPVGLVWIDISREHYGLHGTPEPGKVGHSTSHGCVRLTNWDALRLASMVSKGTPVVFEK